MGRLFWKVFLGFWLTMLTITAVIALSVFVAQQASDTGDEGLDDGGTGLLRRGPWIGDLVQRHAQVLEHGGKPALSGYLSSQRPPRTRDGRERRRMPTVLAIDAQGRDLFDRPATPALLAAARQALQNDPGALDVARVVTAQGEAYLLFAPRDAGRAHSPRTRPWWTSIAPWTLAVSGLLFSLLFAAMLAWYLARPIRALRDGFDRLAQGDLDTRVAHLIGARRDELADLGRDFDRTAQRLQGLIQSQRRLLHDVSHELRSPLARIQAAIGLMHQSPERRDKMIERVEQESIRLDQLVGEILTLSRLDEGQGHGEPQPIDLEDLIADICADAGFEGQARHISVDLHMTPLPAFRGHPALLQRAIENLVRNAIKFSPDGAAVDVLASSPDPHVVIIEVLDRGPGIAPDQVDKVLEPFFRAQEAAGQAPGFGLGLTIAHRAVQLHHGSIRLAPREGGGLRAVIKLPI